MSNITEKKYIFLHRYIIIIYLTYLKCNIYRLGLKLPLILGREQDHN